MATITPEDVKHISKLIKINVTGDEDRLAKMFEETLNYINILYELDTSKVEGTYQVTGLTNVFQKDNQKKETLTTDEALKNAKERVGDLFATKAVFNRDK